MPIYPKTTQLSQQWLDSLKQEAKQEVIKISHYQLPHLRQQFQSKQSELSNLKKLVNKATKSKSKKQSKLSKLKALLSKLKQTHSFLLEQS